MLSSAWTFTCRSSSGYIRIALTLATILHSGFLAFAASDSPLDVLHPNWSEQRLDLSLVEPADRSVERGGPITVSIKSTKLAYFAILLIDDRGDARLVLPALSGENAQLIPGDTRTFPIHDRGENLPADMAPGAGKVFVIASSKPIFDNSKATAITGVHLINSTLRDALAGDSAIRISWDFVSVTVKDPATVKMLTANELVDFFSDRVRGPGAQEGLLLQFDLNSDRLQDLGLKQLEQLGIALNNPEIRGQRFIVEGHTDDIGSESYNLDLSLRRARAAVKYLVDKKHVDPSRLTATGVGARDTDVEPGHDLEKSRENSRRVIIRRVDDQSSAAP